MKPPLLNELDVNQQKPVSSIIPTLLFMLFDYVGVVITEHIAFAIRNKIDFWNHAHYYYANPYIYIWVPLLFLIFLGHSRSYRQMQPIIDMMRDIFLSVFYGWIASIMIIYFMRASNQASRLFIILFGILVLINVCVIRYSVLKFMKLRHIFYEPIIIIGAGLTAERALKFFR